MLSRQRPSSIRHMIIGPWIRRSSSSSSSSSSDSQGEPPRPNYLSRETMYPFLVLSCITSLALNLSHAKSEAAKESRHLTAQISVLERVVDLLNSPSSLATGQAQQHEVSVWTRMSDSEREQVERELELVGLGRGKGRESIEQEVQRKAREVQISWKEVLLGKKGQGFEQEADTTDWEKVFREADEAEQQRQARGGEQAVPAPVSVPAHQVDRHLPRAPPTRASPVESSPPASSSSSSSSYL